MKKLKNQLQYDASTYIHVAILVGLFILCFKSYIAIILLVLESIYIFKKAKNILIYALVIVLIVFIRTNSIDNQKTNLPVTGSVTQVFENSFYLKSDGLILCYYDDMEQIYPGMKLEVSGYIVDTSTYQIMNTFDYETYLLSKSIKSVVSVIDIQVLSYQFNLNILQFRIKNYIDNTYSEETAAFIKLFFLGEKENLNDDFQETTSNLGISHIFAISGMHLGLIVLSLSKLLKKFYISKEKHRMIIVCFLVIYNIITGFKISILRASLLLIGVYIKDYWNILLTKTDLLSFSCLGFLLFNPYIIYNLGFQLSYLIAFSIIMGDYLFQDKNFIQRMAKTTLFANVISLPIMLNFNHSIGLIFIFANVFFLIYINYLFLPATFLVLIFPIFNNVYVFIIHIFSITLQFFSQTNLLIHLSISQPIYMVLYWGLIFWFMTTENKKRRMNVIFMILIVILINITFPFKSNTFVRFLDVSQGDAIHIHNGEYDMLIDTGNTDNYDTLVDYFESYNIKDIDVLLITHFHSDHYGEIHEIIENFDVDTIYLNKAFNEISHDYIILNEGDSFYCGNTVHKVLSANTNSCNENNNSIVLYSLIGNQSYLFTGDIESEIEEDLLSKYDFNVDVLKVPHHGSSTSSTIEFIKKANAPLGIISVGENNSYSLPNEDVISLYLNQGTNIFRTDELGTVTIYYYNFIDFRIIETFKLGKRPHYCL